MLHFIIGCLFLFSILLVIGSYYIFDESIESILSCIGVGISIIIFSLDLCIGGAYMQQRLGFGILLTI